MNELLFPRYFKQAGEDGVIFCMHGPMSQETIEMLEEALKKRVTQEQSDSGQTRRVFAIFVEQVQNIIRYSEDRVFAPMGSGELGAGMVIVGHKEGHFFVSCGNLIKTVDQPRLEQQLLTIQDMDREQLRTYCKQRGRSEPMAGSRGAGLGLIEMARQSSNFSFCFSPWDESLTLFAIQVII
ncbi:MAG: SiaB family protein kinase [Magnetococcus sp. DMHC-8]